MASLSLSLCKHSLSHRENIVLNIFCKFLLRLFGLWDLIHFPKKKRKKIGNEEDKAKINNGERWQRKSWEFHFNPDIGIIESKKKILFERKNVNINEIFHTVALRKYRFRVYDLLRYCAIWETTWPDIVCQNFDHFRNSLKCHAIRHRETTPSRLTFPSKKIASVRKCAEKFNATTFRIIMVFAHAIKARLIAG